METRVFTFDDWLNNNFVFEKGLTNEYVFNDSEQYSSLVWAGKMTHPTLNEIQDAQSETYEYLIKCSLEISERFLKRTSSKSPEFKQAIELEINEINEYKEKNKDLYREVIRPHLHRGIKKGAKYILPEQYLQFKNNEQLDAFIPVYAPYSAFDNGKIIKNNSINLEHLQMEVKIEWEKRLKSIKANNYQLTESPQTETKTDKFTDWMYSIDSQQAITVNASNKVVTIEGRILEPGSLLKRINIKPINEFDLVNTSHFDLTGNIVKESANPKDYDYEFSKSLARLTTLYRCGDFLEYHFQKTPDKALFLKYVQFHVLLYWHRKEGNVHQEKEKFIIEWIEKKKNLYDIAQRTKNEGEQEIGTVSSRTREIISNQFETIDKNKRWEYAFTSESDYNTFLNLLTDYFEYKPYSLPQNTIKLKKDTKTRLAKALSPIHKQLSNENKKLKSDTDFFNLIRVLDHFENLTDTQIYQAITK